MGMTCKQLQSSEQIFTIFHETSQPQEKQSSSHLSAPARFSQAPTQIFATFCVPDSHKSKYMNQRMLAHTFSTIKLSTKSMWVGLGASTEKKTLPSHLSSQWYHKYSSKTPAEKTLFACIQYQGQNEIGLTNFVSNFSIQILIPVTYL